MTKFVIIIFILSILIIKLISLCLLSKHEGYNFSNTDSLKRITIYNENVNFIQEFNKKPYGYKLKINKFSTWTDDEYNALFLQSSEDNKFMSENIISTKRIYQSDLLDIYIPPKYYNNFDLSTENNIYKTQCVSPVVRDQGDCGCCYAFPLIEIIQTSLFLDTYFINYKPLISTKTGGIHVSPITSLSAQQIIDTACRTTQNNDVIGGCVGLTSTNLLINLNISKPFNICSESTYPYASEFQTNSIKDIEDDSKLTLFKCLGNQQHNKCPLFNTPISGFEQIIINVDDRYLKNAIFKYGVLAVSIDCGSNKKFKHYSHGIYSGPPKYGGDHILTLVGWGTTKTMENFWILKNSWNIDWGMEGYIYIPRLETGKNLYFRNIYTLSKFRPCLYSNPTSVITAGPVIYSQPTIPDIETILTSTIKFYVLANIPDPSYKINIYMVQNFITTPENADSNSNIYFIDTNKDVIDESGIITDNRKNYFYKDGSKYINTGDNTKDLWFKYEKTYTINDLYYGKTWNFCIDIIKNTDAYRNSFQLVWWIQVYIMYIKSNVIYFKIFNSEYLNTNLYLKNGGNITELLLSDIININNNIYSYSNILFVNSNNFVFVDQINYEIEISNTVTSQIN